MKLNLGLAALLLIIGGLVNVLMWYGTPAELGGTVLQHTWAVFLGYGGDDSWGPMAAALEHLRRDPAAPLYSELVFNEGVKFQYPPSALFFLKGLLLFGTDRVRISDDFVLTDGPAMNDIAAWIFLFVNVLAVAALTQLQLQKHHNLKAGFGPNCLLRLIIVGALTLTFFPIVKAFTLGQIQVWINALFAVALLCWAVERKVAAGATIGLICLIKPHFGLLLLWALVRGEWRFAAAGAMVGLTGLAAAIAVFGLANHFDYLKLLSFISERGEVYYPNQSMNGLFNRLAVLGTPDQTSNLSFSSASFAPYNSWVRWGTLTASLVLLVSALFKSVGRREPVADFCIMALSTTLAAPVAWEHHYGIVLPVFVVAFAGMNWNVRRLMWIIVSYALVCNFYPHLKLLADTVLNPLQSLMFFGGLLLLVLLHINAGESGSSSVYSTGASHS